MGICLPQILFHFILFHYISKQQTYSSGLLSQQRVSLPHVSSVPHRLTRPISLTLATRCLTAFISLFKEKRPQSTLAGDGSSHIIFLKPLQHRKSGMCRISALLRQASSFPQHLALLFPINYACL